MKKRRLSLDKELLTSAADLDGGRNPWLEISLFLTAISLGELSIGGECNSTADCITNGETCPGSCNGTCGTCESCVSICQCFTDAC